MYYLMPKYTSLCTRTRGTAYSAHDANFVIRIVRALVMRGWRLYPRALGMICGSVGSGNKKMHSDYVRVGRRWIR